MILAFYLPLITSWEQTVSSLYADQAHAVTLPSTALIKKKHACMVVHKCIDGKLWENFAGYFSSLSHKITLGITQSVWICHLLELNSQKDLFISRVLSSIMSYLYRFDN